MTDDITTLLRETGERPRQTAGNAAWSLQRESFDMHHQASRVEQRSNPYPALATWPG